MTDADLIASLCRTLAESGVALREHDHDECSTACAMCEAADEVEVALSTACRLLLDAVDRLYDKASGRAAHDAWSEVEVYCGEVLANDVERWRDAGSD